MEDDQINGKISHASGLRAVIFLNGYTTKTIYRLHAISVKFPHRART